MTEPQIIVTWSGRKHYAGEPLHDERRTRRWAHAMCSGNIVGYPHEDLAGWKRHLKPLEALPSCVRCANAYAKRVAR